VIVRDFDFVGISLLPAKADPKLIVDANTVFAGAVSTQTLQTISWRHAQVTKVSNSVELSQFSPNHGPERFRAGLTRSATLQAVEQVLRGAAGERAYHAMYYNGYRNSTVACPMCGEGPSASYRPIRPRRGDSLNGTENTKRLGALAGDERPYDRSPNRV
jgi:hypothetical protein